MNLAVAMLKETNRLLKLVFLTAIVMTVILLSRFIVILTSDTTTLHSSSTSDLDANVTSGLNSNAVNTHSNNLTYFQKLGEDSRFYELMELFDRLMNENGLTYFLYGGTLLGSYRHHGMIPWDDDLDIIVPNSLRDLVRKAFAKISPADYVLYFDFNCYWKLFSSRWDIIDAHPWKFPFLDIFFYADNETHIWDVCPDYKGYFSYAKSIIFPLRRRPFLNLSLPAPRRPQDVIVKTYSIDVCRSSYFLHSLEQFINYTEIPCVALHSMFPFVTRTYVNGGCNETLVDQAKISNVFFDWGERC